MITLVTIPGIMSDARTWAPLGDAMRSMVDTVHVADTTADDTLDAIAFRALAHTEGNLIVAAHSMGGRVAMEMGRQAPNRVKAMILSSTAHKAAPEDETKHREARIVEANSGMKAYAEAWVPKVISPANAGKADLIARIRTMVEECSPETHERQNRALLSRPDASSYIGEFPFPVLLVTGADDKISTEASHAEIAAAIPDAESVVVDGAGHLLPFEQPERVVTIALEWLDRKGILSPRSAK